MAADGKIAIALIGFMAAGKTRAGAAIARALGEDLTDTDSLISDRLGEPLETYFEREGEASFRELEERVVLEALDQGGVVALGGGAVTSERIRTALDDHVTVWCRVREEVAWKRARGTGRPLAAERDRFSALFAEREPLYRAAGRVVLPRGGDETPARAAPWISAMRGRPEFRIAWGRTSSAEYPVVIGAGAGELATDSTVPQPGRRLFAVADGAALAGAAELPAGLEAAIEARGGEQAKTLGEAERVLAELTAAGVRRDDALLALGGGVVGDLAGFCAAVYQRGIPVLQQPTTLVAQVDAAIGGKTGVDLPTAKNYVGAYHQPTAVLTDPAVLSTLPEAELAAGFAEVVKTALISGGELWDLVRAMRAPTHSDLERVIFDCALTKLGVVASDERDSGRRAVLNLGHTVGHAIEAATGYGRYRHGEAVALGLLASLRLAELPELRAEVAEILAAAGLPTALDENLTVDAVVEATARDKKRHAGGLGFVIVREPGEVEHGCEVAPEDLRAAVGELLE